MMPERIKKLYELIDKLNLEKIHVDAIKSDHSNKLTIINEALTHTSAKLPINHERLEFLGDAVLRLIATEFIEIHFPYMKVGERSALRSQLVSDEWLSKVGQSISIEKVLLIGIKASKDNSAKATLQAEATEALIGALFECLRTLEPIHHWLSPYWHTESKKVLADPHKNNPKSALQEWSQSKGLLLPQYQTKEFSNSHGNPKRFFCNVKVSGESLAEGWGGSRKEAEKQAARSALIYLNKSKNFQST
tara:strand:+ start:286 stop:1029 length:744 start_codon:yes stop_codon:yes gene_type:complete